MTFKRLKLAEDDYNRVNKLNPLIDAMNGVGTSGSAGASVAAATSANAVNTTVLTLSALSITMTDATTAGSHGSHQVFTFPEGNIAFLGATCDLTILAGEGGISDTAAVVGGVGTVTVATDNATLTTTEQDLVPSTASPLTAGAGETKGVSLTAGIAVFDGTTTAIEAWLNFAVPDADSSANDTLTVSGTITLTWANLGDV